ncbi:hypothetical protein STANM309S_02336 [Streptomyces tanashiensis]
MADLAPGPGGARAVGRVEPLRDDPLDSRVPQIPEPALRGLLVRCGEDPLERGPGLPQGRPEQLPPVAERQRPHVAPGDGEQVEGDVRDGHPAPYPVGVRTEQVGEAQPAVPVGAQLAVEDDPRRQLVAQVRGDVGKLRREVPAGAGLEDDLPAVEDEGEGTEPVQLEGVPTRLAAHMSEGRSSITTCRARGSSERGTGVVLTQEGVPGGGFLVKKSCPPGPSG